MLIRQSTKKIDSDYNRFKVGMDGANYLKKPQTKKKHNEWHSNNPTMMENLQRKLNRRISW